MRRGWRRTKSFSSAESMERRAGEKQRREEAMRERDATTVSVVGERRSVRRVCPSMEVEARKCGKDG